MRRELRVESRELVRTVRCRRTVAMLAALASVCLLASCSRQEAQPGAASGGEVQAASSKAQLFSLQPDQLGHVQIAPAEITSLQRVLRLPGTVAYNQFETTPVITQVSGPVSRVLLYPGQFVRANQPMLEVSSPDFAQLRTNYLKAQDAFSLAQKNYQRAKDLYAHQAIAEADLQAAESAQVQAGADLQQAQQSLKIVGVNDPARLARAPASTELPVLAPISGEVVERLVSPGQVIQGGATQVFTISNLSTVWVLVNVFQKDLAAVRLGDSVSIQTDAYPTTFQGRISYISPALDPNTRTLQVRIVTQNPGGKLKKDMYVTAVVSAGNIQNALIVPDAALLRDSENQPFVYVETGDNQFAQRSVTIGESQGGKTQILTGLRAGERVVGDGSLFMQFANSLQGK
jgi:membrane fusion protein, heavy metal efflux system